MDLTEKQFAELVEGIGPAPAGGIGRDKRNAPREGQQATLVITLVDMGVPVKLGESLSVTVRDFSPRGIGILLDRKLVKGTRFVAKMTRKSELPLAVLYTAAHCRQLNAHLYLVGAEFTSLLASGMKDAQRDPERERISASSLG
jgi:hypothetical protein